MADASGGFDINQLLNNPLFIGGIAGLLADPHDRAKALLGGLQTGTQMQTAQQQAKLRDLQIKAAEAQQNFNPSDYMQTAPVGQGSATPNAYSAMVGAQMPSTLGGPIGGQTTMQPGAQQGVSFEPAQSTGRVDMPSLLAGGLQAGFSPAAVDQIAGQLDPQTAIARQIALKQAEPYTLGPQQARFEGGQQVAVNNNQPVNQTVQALQQFSALRDAQQPGTPEYQKYDAVVKKLSGQAEQEQFAQRQQELQAQRQFNNGMAQDRFNNQQTQQLQTKANQFSNQLQKIGIPQAQQQLDYIDQTMAKFKGDDIPGYGRFSSVTPSMLLTEDGQKMRQAVASFANVLLKTRSGAAVTDPEQKRFLEELGTGKGMPVERLKQGLEMMKGLLESEKKNAAAGVSNDVLDYYSSTPGTMDFSPYRKADSGGGRGGGVSIDHATVSDIDAAIARKMGK